MGLITAGGPVPPQAIRAGVLEEGAAERVPDLWVGKRGWGQAPNFTRLCHLEHSRLTKEGKREIFSVCVCCLLLPAPPAKSWIGLAYCSVPDTGEMLNQYLLNKLLWPKPVEVRLEALSRKCDFWLPVLSMGYDLPQRIEVSWSPHVTLGPPGLPSFPRWAVPFSSLLS